jgi:hypothetical protein
MHMYSQTKEEKRATREQNPASGRRLDGHGGKSNDDEEEGVAPVISKKLVINPNSKKDKYAGMSRAKRRRCAMTVCLMRTCTYT